MDGAEGGHCEREYSDTRAQDGKFLSPPHFLYPANSNLSYFIETNPAPFLSPFSLEGKCAGTCSWI